MLQCASHPRESRNTEERKAVKELYLCLEAFSVMQSHMLMGMEDGKCENLPKTTKQLIQRKNTET